MSLIKQNNLDQKQSTMKIKTCIQELRNTNISCILPPIFRIKTNNTKRWNQNQKTKHNIIINNEGIPDYHLKLPRLQFLTSNESENYRKSFYEQTSIKSRRTDIKFNDKGLIKILSNSEINAQDSELLKSNIDGFNKEFKLLSRSKIVISPNLESIPESEGIQEDLYDIVSNNKKHPSIDWLSPWTVNASVLLVSPGSSKPSSLPTISE